MDKSEKAKTKFKSMCIIMQVLSVVLTVLNLFFVIDDICNDLTIDASVKGNIMFYKVNNGLNGLVIVLFMIFTFIVFTRLRIDNGLSQKVIRTLKTMGSSLFVVSGCALYLRSFAQFVYRPMYFSFGVADYCYPFVGLFIIAIARALDYYNNERGAYDSIKT